MSDMTRRRFLELSTTFVALVGLSASAAPAIAETLEGLTQQAPPVLWLQGLSCSGCSVSLLNSEHPSPVELLTRHISLQFHSTLSTATGSLARDVIAKTIARKDTLLVVEGSVPGRMHKACMMGEEPFSQQVIAAAKQAKAVLAVGTCAAFGGIPAAANNPTGAMSLPQFLKTQGVTQRVITIPGCPAHPDWIVGTLVHLLAVGPPELDAEGRPTMFFSRTIHDQCHRFPDYERERFARSFSEEGCLFKLGCLGPVTHADCTLRSWNSGINSCIRSGAPCIGCASEHFAAHADFPLLQQSDAKG